MSSRDEEHIKSMPNSELDNELLNDAAQEIKVEMQPVIVEAISETPDQTASQIAEHFEEANEDAIRLSFLKAEQYEKNPNAGVLFPAELEQLKVQRQEMDARLDAEVVEVAKTQMTEVLKAPDVPALKPIDDILAPEAQPDVVAEVAQPELKPLEEVLDEPVVVEQPKPVKSRRRLLPSTDISMQAQPADNEVAESEISQPKGVLTEGLKAQDGEQLKDELANDPLTSKRTIAEETLRNFETDEAHVTHAAALEGVEIRAKAAAQGITPTRVESIADQPVQPDQSISESALTEKNDKKKIVGEEYLNRIGATPMKKMAAGALDIEVPKKTVQDDGAEAWRKEANKLVGTPTTQEQGNRIGATPMRKMGAGALPVSEVLPAQDIVTQEHGNRIGVVPMTKIPEGSVANAAIPEAIEPKKVEVAKGVSEEVRESIAKAATEVQEEKERAANNGKTNAEVAAELAKGIDYEEAKPLDARTVDLTDGPKPIKDQPPTNAEIAATLNATAPEIKQKKTSQEQKAGTVPPILQGAERNAYVKALIEENDAIKKRAADLQRNTDENGLEPWRAEANKFLKEEEKREKAQKQSQKEHPAHAEAAQKKIEDLNARGSKTGHDRIIEKLGINTEYAVAERPREQTPFKFINHWLNKRNADKSLATIRQVDVELVHIEEQAKTNIGKIDRAKEQIIDINEKIAEAQNIPNPQKREETIRALESKRAFAELDIEQATKASEKFTHQKEMLETARKLKKIELANLSEAIEEQNNEKVNPQEKELAGVTEEMERYRNQIRGLENFMAAQRAKAQEIWNDLPAHAQKQFNAVHARSLQQIAQLKLKIAPLYKKTVQLEEGINKMRLETGQFTDYLNGRPPRQPQVVNQTVQQGLGGPSAADTLTDVNSDFDVTVGEALVPEGDTSLEDEGRTEVRREEDDEIVDDDASTPVATGSLDQKTATVANAIDAEQEKAEAAIKDKFNQLNRTRKGLGVTFDQLGLNKEEREIIGKYAPINIPNNEVLVKFQEAVTKLEEGVNRVERVRAMAKAPQVQAEAVAQPIQSSDQISAPKVPEPVKAPKAQRKVVSSAAENKAVSTDESESVAKVKKERTIKKKNEKVPVAKSIKKLHNPAFEIEQKRSRGKSRAQPQVAQPAPIQQAPVEVPQEAPRARGRSRAKPKSVEKPT